MRSLRNFIVAAAALLLAPALLAQTPPGTPRSNQPQGSGGREVGIEDLPWQPRLGLRGWQVQASFPILERVVLVPDEATYLDELSRWSVDARWPVLFEDDHYAPMFIRRYEPKQIIRRDSIGDPPPDRDALPAAVNAVIVNAWGGDPQQDALRDVFATQQYTPPGVVITSPDDPAWTAAAALAAARGQPVSWLTGDWGAPNSILDTLRTTRLVDRVESLVEQHGYSYIDLGDDIDAITICRDLAARARADLPSTAQPPLPPERRGGPTAITDLIGRHPDGRRFAVCGWIFGDATRSTYMAMCSLFLPTTSVTLYDGYPDAEQWAPYRLLDAATILDEAGYETHLAGDERLREAGWQNVLTGGVASDLIFMNTKGNSDFFDLLVGRGAPGDVPILNHPAAVHLVHSWALRTPADRDTVGGRWLERGTYAIVGSSHEPFLHAFVPPKAVAERLTSFLPFLVAARQFDPHPFAPPWKVNTIGDPLLIAAPPERMNRRRATLTDAYGTDLKEHARALMRAAADGDGDAYAEAMRTMVLIGRDDIAVRLWQLADSEGHGPAAAPHALGPLFRARQYEPFMNAWRQVRTKDDRARDMLWHLFTARLNRIDDRGTLMQLQASLRPAMAHRDLTRLAPRLNAVFGREHLVRVIDRAIDQAANTTVRNELNDLADRYRQSP